MGRMIRGKLYLVRPEDKNNLFLGLVACGILTSHSEHGEEFWIEVAQVPAVMRKLDPAGKGVWNIISIRPAGVTFLVTRAEGDGLVFLAAAVIIAISAVRQDVLAPEPSRKKRGVRRPRRKGEPPAAGG
jgi:hypothetical protein